MKIHDAILCSALLAAQLCVYAHAQSPAESPDPTAATVAPAPESGEQKPAAPPAPPPARLGNREMPKLNIKWDCGSCTQNEKVPPLLELEYAQESVAQKYTVSQSETADVSIVEFRQRPPGARAMLGIFAGKDILKLRIKFRGKEFVVEDYMANALQGMNDLCADVAKKTYKQMVTLLDPQ
jgi:hypothetical protein